MEGRTQLVFCPALPCGPTVPWLHSPQQTDQARQATPEPAELLRVPQSPSLCTQVLGHGSGDMQRPQGASTGISSNPPLGFP